MSVINQDIYQSRAVDNIFNVIMSGLSGTMIGGWSAQLGVYFEAGGVSGLISKQMASGYYNVSGLTITSSGQSGCPQIGVSLYAVPDTSGLDAGSYYYELDRIGSGVITTLQKGYLVLYP